MVQVDGTTYRIVARAKLHDVVRLVDDLLLGTFQHQPVFRIVEGHAHAELLRRVARESRRLAKLDWAPQEPTTGNWATDWLDGRRQLLRRLAW